MDFNRIYRCILYSSISRPQGVIKELTIATTNITSYVCIENLFVHFKSLEFAVNARFAGNTDYK